jgi:hypothetical protein
MQSTLLTWGHLTRAMLCAALFSVAFFSACQKESATTNPSDSKTTQLTDAEAASTTATAAQTALMNAFQIFTQHVNEDGILNNAAPTVETRNAKCTKITSSGWQRSVNAIVLDFGDGCMDINGRKISGQLHGRIQKSARTGQVTAIVLSPCNFMVDCAITTGEMVISNICPNAKGQYHFDWAVNNVYLATLDKNTKKVVGDCTMQSKGRGTQSINRNTKSAHHDGKAEGRGDDDDKKGKANDDDRLKTGGNSFADAIFDFDGDQYLFEITSGKIVDPKHGTFGVKTLVGHPVQIDINCGYPNKGIVEISPKAAWILPNFSVDLGNGACDREALVKVGGVLKHTIKMP